MEEITRSRGAEFGAGVPPLSMGLAPTHECPAPVLIGPDGRAEVNDADLKLGSNRFMCCVHPWMRAVIKVEPEHKGHGKGKH